MNADPIPQEDIDREVRRQLRLIGARLCEAMAAADMKPSDADARLGWDEGETMREIAAMLDGRLTRRMAGLRHVIGLAMAMGTRVEITLLSYATPTPPHGEEG